MRQREESGGHALVHERAPQCLDTRDDHIRGQIAFQFVRRLLPAHSQANERVVLPAIILHDIPWRMIPENRQVLACRPNVTGPDLERLHEVEGARLANGIPATYEDHASVRDEIAQIINGQVTHRVALTLSDQIVKDSDTRRRFSSPGTATDCRRFRIPWRDHVDWHGHRIEDWPFTKEGLRPARRTLHQTLREEHKAKEVT